MIKKELLENIKDFSDDIEIFFKNRINPCGNINSADKIEKSTYGFFGDSIDCLIIDSITDDNEEANKMLAVLKEGENE